MNISYRYKYLNISCRIINSKMNFFTIVSLETSLTWLDDDVSHTFVGWNCCIIVIFTRGSGLAGCLGCIACQQYAVVFTEKRHACTTGCLRLPSGSSFLSYGGFGRLAPSACNLVLPIVMVMVWLWHNIMASFYFFPTLILPLKS